MNQIEQIQWITPANVSPSGAVGPYYKSSAGQTVSGTLDLRGYTKARVIFVRNVNSTAAAGPGIKIYLRHASSSKTWANGTALGTVVSGTAITSANTSGKWAYDVDMANIGPYLTYKMSAITTSSCIGVICEASRGGANPATNLGNLATSGFTALTKIPDQP